jgi:uncharacterized protein DUF481
MTTLRHLLPILVLAPGLAAAAPSPVTPEWSGTAGAGLILLTGNTRTLTVNGTSAVQREWAKWILAVRANGVYGRTRPADRALPAETVAAAASGQVRGDRKLAPHFSVFTMAGADTDHVASVEYRAYGDAGASYVWIDEKREGDRHVFLRTDLGGRYAYESRWQYYATATQPVGNIPDVDLLAPRLGATFRLGLSKDTTFLQEAEALANVLGDERYTARSMSKLTTRIVSALTIGASYLVTWDSAPAPGKVEADTALSVIAEVAF